jgi:hypothetical protein
LSRQKPKVAIKFCGSCNPYIDLSRIARHLTQEAAGQLGFHWLTSAANDDDVDVIVILCGCPRACADRDEVRSRARYALTVAGENLDGTAVSEADLPRAVEQKLSELLRVTR